MGADLRPCHLAADRSASRVGGCSAAEIRPIRRLRVHRSGADHLCTRRRCRWLQPHRSRLRRGSPQRIHRAVFGLQGLPSDPPTKTGLSLATANPTTFSGTSPSGPRRTRASAAGESQPVAFAGHCRDLITAVCNKDDGPTSAHAAMSALSVAFRTPGPAALTMHALRCVAFTEAAAEPSRAVCRLQGRASTSLPAPG